MMKAFFGDKATAENSWGFDWLPKWDKRYDVLQYFEMMNQVKVNGYICQALTGRVIPEQKQGRGFTVETEIPGHHRPAQHGNLTFWQNHGESNDVDHRKSRPKCSVCRHLLRRRERFYRQLRSLAAVALERRMPGIAVTDGEILAGIFLRLRKNVRRRGRREPGTGAEHDLELLHTTRTGFGRSGDGEQR
jgi:formate dehydrogenase major subunit